MLQTIWATITVAPPKNVNNEIDATSNKNSMKHEKQRKKSRKIVFIAFKEDRRQKCKPIVQLTYTQCLMEWHYTTKKRV